MGFTTITTNTGSGGPNVASQTASSVHYPAGCLVYGTDGSFTPVLVGLNKGLPVQLSDPQGVTYSVSTPVAGVVPAASCTDLFELNNSAGTKTILVTRITFSASAGTTGLFPITLLKRSTLNTGGTSSTPTISPHDSGDTAATAVFKTYTVNPTTGSLIGNIRSEQYNIVKAGNDYLNVPVIKWEFGTRPGSKPIKLLANQSLCINLGAGTITSGLAFCDVEWVEYS